MQIARLAASSSNTSMSMMGVEPLSPVLPGVEDSMHSMASANDTSVDATGDIEQLLEALAEKDVLLADLRAKLAAKE